MNEVLPNLLLDQTPPVNVLLRCNSPLESLNWLYGLAFLMPSKCPYTNLMGEISYEEFIKMIEESEQEVQNEVGGEDEL